MLTESPARLRWRLDPWVVWLPLLAFGLGLGWAPLFDVDEGAFAEATREMLQRRDWIATWLNDQPRYDKPILIYWLQALAVAVLGPSEWAFRAPSALAACAWAWAVWHFARPRLGHDAARLALAMVCTAWGPWIIGRAATADALLNLWLTLAGLDIWRYLEVHPGENRVALRRAYAWVALGLLTKGPVAALVPAAAAAVYCLSRRELRPLWVAARDPWGWLLLLGIAGPWYAAILATHGQAFIDGFILKHNVQRFTHTLEGHGGSLVYYVVMLPLLLAPWSLRLPGTIARLRQDWQDPLAVYLWGWALFVLAFFSLSGTKLPHYVLYGSTPLFLLLARHWGSGGRLPLFGAVALLGLWPALPWLTVMLAERASNGYYADQLRLALALAGPGYWVVTLGAAALGLALFAWRRGSTATRMMALAALHTLVLALAVAPWAGEVLQGAVKRAGLQTRAAGVSAVTWRFDAPSFSVYRQAVTPRREPAVGEWALTRSDRDPPWPAREHDRRGGVVLLERLPDGPATPGAAQTSTSTASP
jgi:4-amino-4-deoxy-L-arabinose transferase-like glycosyltransferase